MEIQIDVTQIKGNTVMCNMYTGVLCVRIAMSNRDYEELIRKGFFIRDGKTLDSANVLNTTEVYKKSNP